MVVTLEARQHDQTGESVPTIAMPSDLQPVSEKRYLSSQMGQLSRPVQGSPGFSMAHRPYRTLPSPAARGENWAMSGERTILIPPCADSDEMDFYTAVEFVRGFRQLRPMPACCTSQ